MKDSNNSKQFMKMNSTVSDVLEEEEEKGALPVTRYVSTET